MGPGSPGARARQPRPSLSVPWFPGTGEGEGGGPPDPRPFAP